MSLRGSASAEPRMIEEIDEVRPPANILNQMRRTRAQWAFEATQEVTARPVDIPELLQENRAVVLGDPGAGKTTLLRYVAYGLVKSQLANGQSGSSIEYLTLPAAYRYMSALVNTRNISSKSPNLRLTPSHPLAVRCANCHCLTTWSKMRWGKDVFCFSWMAWMKSLTRSSGARWHSASRIRISHPRCGMLVTSLVVGYREAPLSREFSQFTISPFGKDEIHRFIQSWYKALGMPEGADKLVQAVEGSSFIRRLASNPLLLTVIALIRWRGDKLPRHRVRLYRLASETLVDEWMSHRR